MALLNRLFGSAESIAKSAEIDEQIIFKIWNEYLNTISEKEKIINQLLFSFGQRKALLLRLKQLLDIELAEIYATEKEENDLVANIQSLEHSKKIKRVHQLEICLAYSETKFKYVYQLLLHLYSTLKLENLLLKKLIVVKDLRKYRELVNNLKAELVVEETILNKIKDVKNFHNIISDLVKGEHIIYGMDSKEKKILKKIQKGMSKIFSNETNKGITYEWAIIVFNKIEDMVHEEVAKGNGHVDLDFEIVNKPIFVNLSRAVIQDIKKTKVSEQMINVFVHLFREWYNHERGQTSA